jgi:dTMP kinase
MGSELILRMHRIVCGELWPEMTILMDSDPAASVARARRRNKANAGDGVDENRFERETGAFFDRVHAAYNAIAQREPGRVFKVDARRPKDVTHATIVRAVRERLG